MKEMKEKLKSLAALPFIPIVRDYGRMPLF